MIGVGICVVCVMNLAVGAYLRWAESPQPWIYGLCACCDILHQHNESDCARGAQQLHEHERYAWPGTYAIEQGAR